MAVHKCLVTGGSGLLGRAVMKEFQDNLSWDVLGIALHRIKNGVERVDLTDAPAVQKIIREYKPDVVIHAAAERRPDVVESNVEGAKKLNVEATKTLAEEASAIGAWLVFISTDYVFDGTDPPYKEDDSPNPLNTYGQLKLEGEEVVRQSLPDNHCILRLPVLYGPLEYVEESAITIMVKALLNSDHRCKFSDYEKRYPTCTSDCAVVLRELAERKLSDSSFSGTFHWSGDERLTRFLMVEYMAEVFHLPMYHVEPNPVQVLGTPRPYNAALDCSKLQSLGIGLQKTSFRDGIKICLEPFVKEIIADSDKLPDKND